MHTTEKHYNAYRKIIGRNGVSLAFESWWRNINLFTKESLLSVQSTQWKHKHTINKHSNNQQTIDETYIVANKSDMSFRVSYYGMCWSSFVWRIYAMMEL